MENTTMTDPTPDQPKIPSRDGRPGDIVRNHRHGEVVVIRERKADDTGWWLEDNHGGLADRAIDHGDWQIVWQAPDAG
jgi:hypothetical protein